jgi:hypothetical protein
MEELVVTMIFEKVCNTPQEVLDLTEKTKRFMIEQGADYFDITVEPVSDEY